MGFEQVFTDQSFTSNTAANSTLFSLQNHSGNPAIVSVIISSNDDSSGAGTNDFSVRLYYSPDHRNLVDTSTAHWIEADSALFKPIFLTAVEDYDGTHGDSTSLFEMRILPANSGQFKLVGQRHGDGTQSVVLSAWVEW